MKLVDLATGSDWIVWIVFVIFAVFSIILLSGHGSWFISGYNTASKEEKEKYDEKKLCRTMGIGMSIIAILALTISKLMDYLQNDLPKLTLEQAKFKQSIGLNKWDSMPEGVEYPESIR